MAEAFAPFIINRTIGKLTFYVMDGRNFVRKKSSLTRRKVLHAPCFENTRRNAALMGQASKIGSFVFNSLPECWRQSWMYRSFTGEAYTLLKKGQTELEIRQFLWQRYVKEVVARQAQSRQSPCKSTPSKRAYCKKDTQYWEHKTRRRQKRAVIIERRQRNAALLAEASQIASRLYHELPLQTRKRSHFQYLTGWAMKWLKEQEAEFKAETALPETIPGAKEQKKAMGAGYVYHRNGYFVLAPMYLKKVGWPPVRYAAFCSKEPAIEPLPCRGPVNSSTG